MKIHTAVISFLLFSVFFILGLKIGNSPINSGIDYADETRNEISHLVGGIYSAVPAGYILEKQYNQDILHYDISINLYPDKREITGRTIITGRMINFPADTIVLNFYDNMKINSLLVNGNENEFLLKNKWLKIPVGESVPDTFKITVDYAGTPKRAGLASFVFGEINGESLVYTLNEPNYASTWFPCNDMPDDKVLIDIHITNDKNKTSVSNGRLMNVSEDGSRKTYSWKTFYPISTYLISLYSAEYVNFTENYITAGNDTILLDYYCLPWHEDEARADFGGHKMMMEVLSGLFGEYPFIKEKYGVAEFLWQLGAMEHQTITGIGSNFVSGRNFFEDVYVHELAHHWWGNAVGPKTWKDIWLNEGFASYSEALYYEKLTDKRALQSTMLAKFSSDFPGTLYNPKDLFNETVYDKGAWVLHMLRKETGDSIFFKILRDYFETFKYSNSSTEDFKALTEKISGKDLTKFFNQWVYDGKGIIKCEYLWEIDDDVLSLNIQQVQKGYNEYHFPLDVKIKLRNGEEFVETVYVDDKEKTFSFKINEMPEEVELDPENWLLAEFYD